MIICIVHCVAQGKENPKREMSGKTEIIIVIIIVGVGATRDLK